MHDVLEYIFPITAKHGRFTITGRGSRMETPYENALWTYNHTLAHDGFPPVTKFPKGTMVRIPGTELTYSL